MAVRSRFLERSKAAGVALVAIGAWLLYTRLLDGAANPLRDLLSLTDATGILPALVLVGSRVIHGCSVCHRSFLQVAIEQVLVTCWPLMLVLAGTALSRDDFHENGNALDKNKDSMTVDPSAAGSTLNKR